MNTQKSLFEKVMAIPDKIAEWKDKLNPQKPAPGKWRSQKIYKKGVVIETARRGPKRK